MARSRRNENAKPAGSAERFLAEVARRLWFAIRGDTVRGRVLDTETVDYGILNQKLFQIECGTDRILSVESFTLAFEGANEYLEPQERDAVD